MLSMGGAVCCRLKIIACVNLLHLPVMTTAKCDTPIYAAKNNGGSDELQNGDLWQYAYASRIAQETEAAVHV